MDGVLTDNMRFHAESWVELFKDFGFTGIDPERYLVETAGMKGHDVLRYFLDPEISESEAERLTEFKDFLYRVTNRAHIAPISGLTHFLKTAAQAGIALGIGTGASQKNIAYVLELLQLETPFGAIVDPSQVQYGKPAPDIFLHAATLLGVRPDACIVFEDALPGVEAARKAGMRCVAVTTTNPPEAFAPFDNIVATINDYSTITPGSLLMKLAST